MDDPIEISAGVSDEGSPFLRMTRQSDGQGLAAGLDGPQLRSLVAQLLAALQTLPPSDPRIPAAPLTSMSDPRWQVFRTERGDKVLSLHPALLPTIDVILTPAAATRLAAALTGDDA